MLETYKMRNMRTPQDKTYLQGLGDPLITLNFWLERQIAANPMVTNLQLTKDDWSAITGAGVAAELTLLFTAISNALSSKTAQTTTVAIDKGIDTATTTAWTDIARLGSVTPLHRVGPDHLAAPRVPPDVNKRGPFGWTAARTIWGATVMGDTVTPPPTGKGLLDLMNGVTPILDRCRGGDWGTLIERLSVFYTVTKLAGTATDPLWWGQAIFGAEAKEMNRMPAVVHAKRCFNVRSIGAYWQLQPHLLAIYALKTWLFGGVGSTRLVYAEMLRDYAKYALDELEARMTNILELGMAPIFAEACARFGWAEMRTTWGSRPAIELPYFLHEFLDQTEPELRKEVAKGEGSPSMRGFHGRGLLKGGAPLLAQYVSELDNLTTATYFKDGYDRCKALFGGVPPRAYRPPPGQLDAYVVTTDGMLASDPVDHHTLLDARFVAGNAGILPVGTLPRIERVDTLGGESPELMGVVGNVAIEERLLELVDPRLWRPMSEYQGDADAVYLPGGDLVAVATTAGVPVEELTKLILASPKLWAHIFDIDTKLGSIVPRAPASRIEGLFLATRFANPNIYRFTLPKTTRAVSYRRMLEGRPYMSGNPQANLLPRQWLAIATLEVAEMSQLVAGAVETLLAACAISNPIARPPTPTEALPSMIQGA